MSATWKICARHIADPAPPNWREVLALRLGERPRRIGAWAELALYGALNCLDAAREPILAPGASLWVCSMHGPLAALKTTLEQVREGYPQPFSFLQCQPATTLATLGSYLGWAGDAVSIAQRDPLTLVRLACARNSGTGLLVGWVDETPAPRSSWLRLTPGEPASAYQPARVADLFAPDVTGLGLRQGQLLAGRG